mmetsp:Transcript_86897/g.172515  ORF Transcript_86897/g.172515 Transcript_86897/m.172515 type:complete len:200 (+) Transcript_86897:2105-2704(+)
MEARAIVAEDIPVGSVNSSLAGGAGGGGAAEGSVVDKGASGSGGSKLEATVRPTCPGITALRVLFFGPVGSGADIGAASETGICSVDISKAAAGGAAGADPPRKEKALLPPPPIEGTSETTGGNCASVSPQPILPSLLAKLKADGGLLPTPSPFVPPWPRKLNADSVVVGSLGGTLGPLFKKPNADIPPPPRSPRSPMS